MSTTARLTRKKYMGVCRAGLELMPATVSRFPERATVHRRRKPERSSVRSPVFLRIPE